MKLQRRVMRVVGGGVDGVPWKSPQTYLGTRRIQIDNAFSLAMYASLACQRLSLHGDKRIRGRLCARHRPLAPS